MAAHLDTPAKRAEHERMVGLAEYARRCPLGRAASPGYVTAGCCSALWLLRTTTCCSCSNQPPRRHIERALHDTNQTWIRSAFLRTTARPLLRANRRASPALVEDAGPALGRQAHVRLEPDSQPTAVGAWTLIDDPCSRFPRSRGGAEAQALDITGVATRIAADLKRAAPRPDVAGDGSAPGLARQWHPAPRAACRQNLIYNAWKFITPAAARRPRIEVGPAALAADASGLLRAQQRRRLDPEVRGNSSDRFQRLHGLSTFPRQPHRPSRPCSASSPPRRRVWADGRVDGGRRFYFPWC